MFFFLFSQAHLKIPFTVPTHSFDAVLTRGGLSDAEDRSIAHLRFA